MANILEMLQQQMTPEVMAQMGKQLGVDQQTVQKGIEVGLPLLLAALARNSSTPEGAQALTNALQKDHDGSILNNVPAAVGSYQSGPGNAILGHVLGNQQPQVEQAMSKTTGIDGAALLQMLAPLVLGALGSVQRKESLDPGGVASTLQKNQEQMAQQPNSPMMTMIMTLLDTNRDGSVIDDVLMLAGRYFQQQQQQQQ